MPAKRSEKFNGQSGTRLAQIWRMMLMRCYNTDSISYPNYGARGVTVCQDWIDRPLDFIAWAKSNGYSEELTLDRIDVDGRYEPSNCKWSDKATQAYNKRLQCNNVYGVPGISETRAGNYFVRITVNKVRYDIGTFYTLEDAIAARIAAEYKYTGESKSEKGACAPSPII